MNRLTNEELDAIADGSGHYTDGWAIVAAAVLMICAGFLALAYAVAVG